MKKSLQNKLKAYSAISAVAAFGASDAVAQMSSSIVNYTGGYESYDIDIDGDGTVDFKLEGRAPTTTTSSYTTNTPYPFGTWYWGNRKDDVVKVANKQGLFLLPQTFATSSGGTSTNQAIPYPYSSGSAVGLFNSSFSNNSSIPLVSYATGSTYRVVNLSSGYYGGAITPWYTTSDTFTSSNGYFGGETDSYIGVMFNIDDEPHLGWIRIGVANDGSTWTVRETGYDMQPYVTAFTQSEYKKVYAATGVSDVDNQLNSADIKLRVTPDWSHDYSGEVGNYKLIVVKDDGREFGVIDAFNASGYNTWGDLRLSSLDLDVDGDLIASGNKYRIYTLTTRWNGEPLRLTGDVTVDLKNTLGVEDESFFSLDVYSADKTLFVKGSEALVGSTVSVFDMAGKVVLTEKISSTTYSTELNNADGLYVVSIKSVNGSIMTKKVKM